MDRFKGEGRVYASAWGDSRERAVVTTGPEGTRLEQSWGPRLGSRLEGAAAGERELLRRTHSSLAGKAQQETPRPHIPPALPPPWVLPGCPPQPKPKDKGASWCTSASQAQSGATEGWDVDLEGPGEEKQNRGFDSRAEHRICAFTQGGT